MYTLLSDLAEIFSGRRWPGGNFISNEFTDVKFDQILSFVTSSQSESELETKSKITGEGPRFWADVEVPVGKICYICG